MKLRMHESLRLQLQGFFEMQVKSQQIKILFEIIFHFNRHHCDAMRLGVFVSDVTLQGCLIAFYVKTHFSSKSSRVASFYVLYS